LGKEAVIDTARRRVLVTGATGFAGSHLMDALLDAGHEVRVLIRRTSNLRWIPRKRVTALTADVRDPASLRPLVEGVSWVFHFGAATRARSAADLMRINAAGTQALAAAWLESAPADGLFCFCSSLAASGPAPAADRPRRESDPPRPITPYGESKLAAERWLSENLAPHRRLVMVRPPAVYGPRDEATLTFFRWVQRGWLLLPGKASNRASLLHVQDLARGCIALADGDATGMFHLSDGGFHAWEDVGTAAAEALGRKVRSLRIPAWVVRGAGLLGEVIGRVGGRVPVINRSKAHDILQPYWICATERARQCGIAPRMDLAAGVRQTVNWYRSEGWL
jgi:nucleoside-diphosphate-sugar epimerase